MGRNGGLAALFFVFLMAAHPHAAEVLKSGPQPGEELPASFDPYVVTGPFAGTEHCLVCENGLNPCVMIFARSSSDPLLKLLARVESACKTQHAKGLGAFAVFLSKDNALELQLTAVAGSLGLKQLVLSIGGPDGPGGYAIAKDADVTLVFYSAHHVKLNSAFKSDELTDEAIAKFMADVSTLLTEK